jgi:hypothetical protein
MIDAGPYFAPIPNDTLWDRYYNDFELWLNDHYDMESTSIFGHIMSWQAACESEPLLERFVEWWTDGE